MDHCTVPFTVEYFPLDCIDVQIPVRRFMDGDNSVGHLKRAVGQTLQLEERSLKIFGIFLGQLKYPKELLQNNHRLDWNNCYCFRFIGSCWNEELDILEADEKALELVYWEFLYHFSSGLALKFPRPHDQMVAGLTYQRRFAAACITAGYDKLIGTSCKESEQCRLIFNKSNFGDHYLNCTSAPPFYVMYIDVTGYCILKNTLATNASQNLPRRAKVHIVVDCSRLVILNINGQEIGSWNWNLLSLELPVIRSRHNSTSSEDSEESLSSDSSSGYSSHDTLPNNVFPNVTPFMLATPPPCRKQEEESKLASELDDNHVKKYSQSEQSSHLQVSGSACLPSNQTITSSESPNDSPHSPLAGSEKSSHSQQSSPTLKTQDASLCQCIEHQELHLASPNPIATVLPKVPVIFSNTYTAEPTEPSLSIWHPKSKLLYSKCCHYQAVYFQGTEKKN